MSLLVKTFLLSVIFSFANVSCRIHKLPLTDDDRRYVDLTTFGFYQGGVLEVRLLNFRLPSGPVRGELLSWEHPQPKSMYECEGGERGVPGSCSLEIHDLWLPFWDTDYGLTLDRTVNDAMRPQFETAEGCFLRDATVTSPQHPAIVVLKMDFINMRLNISCLGEVNALHLYPTRGDIPMTKRRSDYMYLNRRRRSPHNLVKSVNPEPYSECSYAILPIIRETRGGFDYYNTSFAMYVASDKEEGLYNLYFHNCPDVGQGAGPSNINMMIEIYESNDGGNFLSAGEMPLPALYSLMSLIFFLSAGFWTFLIRTSRHTVYRIHVIMCILVYLKALSLTFHGINYHFIQTRGEHVTAWAILYYITHLLKGAVLFVTIVLVGTGWNFIKHILSDRDKKLFMIVIPLQVVANVAEIIIAESEEGAAEHNAWRDIFILVDLLCCGAILFPVVWSIRHLQVASSTDGKAASINLRKLKLFRHFYVMVVAYIYFTRIIVYLLKITVPFQYSWIDEMFRELATFVFFVTTGYKFRPAAENPYFTPTQDEDCPPQVLSEIGVLEGVTKVSRGDRRWEDLQPLMHETNYNSD